MRSRGIGARRSKLTNWIAGGVAAAVLVTVAVVASGYDARETPREEPSVWSMRSSGQYARVNTETAEIDTVRRVSDPSGLVQLASGAVLLSHGNGRAWTVDPADPLDLLEEEADPGAESVAAEDGGQVQDDDSGPAVLRTPDGTRDAVSAGDTLLLRTEAGEVYLSELLAGDGAEGRGASSPRLSDPVLLDPLEQEEADDSEDTDEPESDPGADQADEGSYRADAVAIDETGRAAMFSAQEQSVRWYDSVEGRFEKDSAAVPAEVPGEGVQLAIVAGEWVLFDAEGGRLWRQSSDGATELDVSGRAVLQSSSLDEAGTDALVADGSGLWEVDRDGAGSRAAEAEGTPAQPVAVGADRYAAWLGTGSGAMWSSRDDVRPLEIDEGAADSADPELVIRSNGSRALVADVRTGMMWTLPEGTLIPVEQWALVDPPKEEQGTVVVQDVTEQEPPVAVDDSFGVRPGEPAPLPVLLNDYDPNRRDVLTVTPAGLAEGFPADFGVVEMLSDGQGLMIRPAPDASGTASFTYRITDGSNVSEPATVTVTVAADEENTAPAWCPVEGCQREWPAPELAPGGTLVLPILEGWVDPQGDPMMLASAEPLNPDDPVRALVTGDGRLAVRHTDPNAGESDVAVRLSVQDARGETTERELRIAVRPGAQMDFGPIASTVTVGETTSLRPLQRVTGGSGSYALVDAVAQSGSLDLAVNQGRGTIEVTAPAEGSTVLTVTVRDTVTESETTGVLRVTAVESRGQLGLPPLRAFVRPLADTTIEVLDAVPGANSRALVVRAANVIDGELQAEVIEHERIRVSGITPDGGPGRIGSADVVIAEGDTTSQGRLTVFQVPENGADGVIAIADTATVRAGAVVDIPVLDNDVSAPGQRLVLHPEIGAPGAEGELAFASGNRVRYLAPQEPGTYTLSYTTYGASSPDSSDVGHVRVTVLPRDGNRDPQPAALTVRVAPGESVRTDVPLSGVDPDGDRVRLVSVGSPEDPQVSTVLAPRSTAVQVEASPTASPGTQLVDYTVRDEFGGEAKGRLRVIVTEPDPNGGAPVVYSDYVRLVQGAPEPAKVRPLENDLDPAGGELELLEVVPNVPGGPESEEYRALEARLDTSEIARGRISIASSDVLGTASYRYTVRSSESQSTADGLIVVQVSSRVGLQAPTVRDTVLSARDRTDLAQGGVDVVTDRVYWAGGDVGDLQLSVWGAAANDYRVSGSRIIGAYKAEGDLVPFRLAGPDATGEEVESFGFLVIPPLDELRLTLQPGLTPLSVDENKSVSANLADVVDLSAGDTAELRQGSFTVQRGQASCSASSTSQFTYSAGREAPWSDVCTISVKLTEQKTWTQLAVPVRIVPDEPVALLQSMTRTVAPGEAQTIDLADMVRWEGGREGRLSNLRFQVSGGGSGFDVTQSGTSVQVQAHADAVPGQQQAVSVSVTGAGESQSTLNLRVGVAPRDAPRGASVSLQCTVGSACQSTVIGAPGEYDPFAGKAGGGLELVSVDGAGCAVGSFRVSGSAVVVSWPDGSGGSGGRCTASFTVKDAQGRTGTGSVSLDAQGVPRAPASISAVGYSATSVTLEVRLSSEAAHPEVTGVRIQGGPGSDSCTASGSTYRCVVNGLRNGQKHTFTAVAFNSVGDSRPTANGVEAWAYEPPERPSVTAKQVSAESSNSGTVELKIEGAAGTSGYQITTAAGTQSASGRNTTVNVSGLPIGTQSYSVLPLSAYDPPPGASPEGTARSGEISVGGLPTVSVTASSPRGTDEVHVQVAVSSNGGREVTHGYRVGNGNCSPGQHDGAQGSYVEASEKYTTVTVTACARNEWGTAQPVQATVNVGGSPEAPTVVSGWSIATAPSISGGSATYGYLSGPTATPERGLTLQFFVNGQPVGSTFPEISPDAPVNSAAVGQCRGTNCTPADGRAAVTGNAPSPVTVDLTGCIASDATVQDLRNRVSAGARNSASPSYDAAAGIFTISWTGSYSGLQTLSTPVASCAPPPGSEPVPPAP